MAQTLWTNLALYSSCLRYLDIQASSSHFPAHSTNEYFQHILPPICILSSGGKLGIEQAQK